MSRVVELLRSRRVPHVAALALMSFGFAGCSADMSTRALAKPFSNPFASQPEATGSVPAAAVERRELPQYSRPQSPYQSQPLPPPDRGAAILSGRQRRRVRRRARARLLCSAGRARRSRPPAVSPPRSVRRRRGAAQARHHDHRRHQRHAGNAGAPLQCHAGRDPAANGYKGPRALSPGQQLIIPHPRGRGSSPHRGGARAAAPAAGRSRLVAAAPSVHVVNPGDTLLSIARRNHVPVAELARANSLDPSAKLKLGIKLTVPGARPPLWRRLRCRPQPPLPSPSRIGAARHQMAAAGGPPQSARLAQANRRRKTAAEAPVKAGEATGALPTFRWPVRGKVITSYGAKTNGKSNDGINLAVPEGTPVKAAEDGVVAYSGNELKGYGNLVLVRHSNGYVTAYAHASELLVKRGDTIKRGQVIAKSGQSGEVGSPQLHFEIRKGSSPVDPLQFLNGA